LLDLPGYKENDQFGWSDYTFIDSNKMRYVN